MFHINEPSMAFEVMDYSLLIAKLRAYGFHEDALVLMKNYFTNRQQSVRVNSNLGMREEIISEFRKFQYWVLNFLTSSQMTFIFLLKTVI